MERKAKRRFTDKMELFCLAYVETGNASEAYRRSYNTANMAEKTAQREGYNTLQKPQVQARIEELRNQVMDRHEITVDTLLLELEQARRLALETKKAAAAVTATMGKAKLLGLDKQIVELTGKDARRSRLSLRSRSIRKPGRGPGPPMNELLDWEAMSSAERQAARLISEHSPLSFMRVWFQLNQGMKFLCNWHHRYMDHTALQVLQGKLKNVVFNMPPGGTKTEYWSIHLPAYVMTKYDRSRNLSVSYSKALVEENSNRIKSIVESSEYQDLWPCSLGKADVANWIICDEDGRNKHQMFSRSTGGQITGVRGGYISEGFTGFINLDDPEKADSAFSATMRAKPNGSSQTPYAAAARRLIPR